MLYQCIQEGYVVLQIGSSLAGELKEFLSNWLFHTQALVFPLWRWNIQRNIKLASWGCIAVWNTHMHLCWQLALHTDWWRETGASPSTSSFGLCCLHLWRTWKAEEHGKLPAAANKLICFLMPGNTIACVLNLALNLLSHLPWRHGSRTCTSNLSGFRQRYALHTAKELLIALT